MKVDKMDEETQSMAKENNDNSIKSNSEILFIYDAKMCNPNGDPDDENKPRMDYERSINLVSDVRLKRYIRDYLMNHRDQTIFVCKVDGNSINAKQSLAIILGLKDKAKININDKQKFEFLKKAIDVRMFGAIIPDVKFENKSNVTFTGPVQFNWGYSLNKVTGPMESSGITSHFQTGKTSEEAKSIKGTGAMGKDYRVDYSIIAFHGVISAKRAEETKLTNADVNLLDEAMIKAIPLEATTRSKKGQTPLLYIRVEYNTPEFFLGDLRKYIKIVDKNSNEIPFDNTAKLRSSTEYKLNLLELKKKLEHHKDKIKDIHFWKHEDIRVIAFDDLKHDNKWKLMMETEKRR